MPPQRAAIGAPVPAGEADARPVPQSDWSLQWDAPEPCPTRAAFERRVGVLVERPIPLVRNFASNLLAYAMGRRVEYYDQPAIRAIVRDAEQNDYRISSFIMGVVKSDPFTMMRSPSATPQ